MEEDDTISKNNIVLQLCKFGITKPYFKIDDLYKTYPNLSKGEKNYIENVLLDSGGTPDPNHIMSFTDGSNHSQYIWNTEHRANVLAKNHIRLLPSAIFSYIDHLEIVEARKAAKVAKEQSTMAIKISIWSLVAAILFGIIEIILTIFKHP